MRATQEVDTLTLLEAAQLLKVSGKTLRDLCRGGRVPHQRLGAQYRFSRSAIREWLSVGAAQQEVTT